MIEAENIFVARIVHRVTPFLVVSFSTDKFGTNNRERMLLQTIKLIFHESVSEALDTV